ncbi:DUF1534 domain-containing protein [Pseudomonas syringae]|nr:DUF1534 domain-containing protein [Pseudomonas syringae]MCF5202276.1 DUF1534 domain-containing protein [Pseudomonas syringae]MCF5269165.1 DUF1534 domain-containing protein [Pseudomonas syringae]MCF5273899.1 DUF1534 domain-containing protein [Pseudomonas syringae]MCF5280442.1 DUF1534 domain-containing protein [Pseudomonas syringae]
MGTIVFLRTRSCRHLSFLTLQRGNAFRDALRHPFADYGYLRLSGAGGKY